MTNKNITIVINTFKSEDKIFNCLNSIDSSYQIIVIENSSNNMLKNQIEQNTQMYNVFLPEKPGYANGNNLGLSKVKSKYALILNPDAVIEKETINNFLITANNRKDFAIIGPAIQNEFSKEQNHKDKEDVFEVKSLKGFAMFLNLEQFKNIGFLIVIFYLFRRNRLCKDQK